MEDIHTEVTSPFQRIAEEKKKKEKSTGHNFL